MRKTIVTLALTAALLISMPVTTFASEHDSDESSGKSYALCSLKNCNSVGYHAHDGVTYSGHYSGDGHVDHQICSVRNCTQTGNHTHNGTTCLPHNKADGHTYHQSAHNRGEHC